MDPYIEALNEEARLDRAREEGRRAGLEEAAKVCEERARGHFQMSPAAAECDECAAACRALAAKEPVL